MKNERMKTFSAVVPAMTLNFSHSFIFFIISFSFVGKVTKNN